jgi:tRNA dimethylallyltransferase
MEASMNSPLIVIVGETASGKTVLAIDLAKQISGEIIAADSRTVYKEMDIGTAKPTPQEKGGIPHFLLDVVKPDHPFSASDFKYLATQAIEEISSRGHVPIMVGGSGLYIDSVIYDFTFRPKADPGVREQLQKLSVQELQERILGLGLDLPSNMQNPVHLIRTIETNGQQPMRKPLRDNTLIIDRQELKTKLKKRVEAMLKQGLIQEIKSLVKNYGWDAPGLQSTSYKAFRQYFEGQGT